jgi:hypothetical protein
MKTRTVRCLVALLVWALCWAAPALAWHDETHLAIAKAAGYRKWYNATGADMAKLKSRGLEQPNHYANNPRGTRITEESVKQQITRYDTRDPAGHLYGAIIAAVRRYLAEKAKGKYGEYHFAFAAHYLGDLSMPLHNTEWTDFNKTHHDAIDGIVNAGALEHLERIRVYPVTIRSEEDLVREVVRVANLASSLGWRLESEDRLPTEEEAYRQLSHSASLLRAVLVYTDAPRQIVPSSSGPEEE